MTTYGTIPTSTPPSEPPLAFLSRAKARGRSALATRRPWAELVDGFSFPRHLSDAYLRARANLSYFAPNYAIVVLILVFFSLLFHPISLIVFFVMLAAWLFLYFLRDDPVVILQREIDDSVVLAVLAVVTLGALLFTNATWNIVGAIALGLVVVVVHALVRKNEDVGVDVEGRDAGGWYTVVDPRGGGTNPSSSASPSPFK